MSQSLLRSSSAIVRRHERRSPVLTCTIISFVAIIFLITGLCLGRIWPPTIAVNDSLRGHVGGRALSTKRHGVRVFVGILVRSTAARRFREFAPTSNMFVRTVCCG
jgi:hypothetical protein